MPGSRTDLRVKVPCHALSDGTNPRIKLTFLQFDDGSIWGDDKARAEMMFQRNDVTAYLQSLKDAYSRGGSNALNQALEQPLAESPDHKLRIAVIAKQGALRRIRDHNDTQAVADEIDKNLASAQEHAIWLR